MFRTFQLMQICDVKIIVTFAGSMNQAHTSLQTLVFLPILNLKFLNFFFLCRSPGRDTFQDTFVSSFVSAPEKM